MKALPSLLAALLMSSGASLAQTAPTQPTAPTQQTVAGGESAKPEAASQASTPSPSPTASTPSTDAAAASADGVPAAPLAPTFVPGAKLYLEPMNGFDQFVARAIIKKKVPVVVVNDREKADFVMSGEANVKKPGFFAGQVLSTHGKGDISITDAHTGNMVFAHRFKRADANLIPGEIYKTWGYDVAREMKKALEKK